MSDINNNQNDQVDTSSGFEIKELFYLARLNIMVIVKTFLLTSFFMFLFYASALPSYTVSAKVYVKDDISNINPFAEISGGRARFNLINNQIEIIKSRVLSDNTAKALSQLEERDNLYLFKTRDENQDLNNLSKQGLRKILLSEIPFYNSFEESLSKNPNLIKKSANKIRNTVVVTSSRNSDLINLSYSSDSSEEAALILNTLIDEYRKLDILWQNNEHIYLQSFLSSQLTIKENELGKIEEDLRSFQQENQIFGLDNDTEIILSNIQTVESELYKTKTEIQILEKRENFYKNTLNDQEERLSEKLTNTIDTQLFSLREELAITEAEYLSSKSKNNSNEMALQSIEKKISSLKKSISEQTNELIDFGITASNPIEFRQSLVDSLLQIRSTKSALQARLDETGKVLDIYEDELESLPNKFLQFSRLVRDKNILDGTYQLMKQRFEESRIAEASQIGKIRIVDSAIPTSKASWPPSPVILIFFIFAFTVSFSAIYIIMSNYFNSSVNKIDYIENLNISILSIIPSFAIDKRRKKNKSNTNSDSNDHTSRLILKEDSKSPISESYRTLRTSLEFIEKSSNFRAKRILISSSGPQEGKSTTSANIAIAFANQGKKTLIIDADMRKPVLHKTFSVDKNKGISKMFVDNKEKNFDSNIQKTSIDNLSILCCGPTPPNPSELISSEKFTNALEDSFEKYDVIICDTPPLIAVTDAVLLRKYFDELILVIRLNKTEKGALDRSMKNLSNINYNIKYCILNEVSNDNFYGSYYYYNYYHYYYGESDN